MKQVILTILEGSFAEGFQVVLKIQDVLQSEQSQMQETGALPPASAVLAAFKEWEEAYHQLAKTFRLTPIADLPSNISITELAKSFYQLFQAWLNSGEPEWQKIWKYLVQNLNCEEEILVIVETNNSDLRRLPWQLWELFSETYSRAEVVLSTTDYKSVGVTYAQRKPRLLAIFGNDQGINLEVDQQVLRRVKTIDVITSVKPPLQKLVEQLWDGSWDILYFAGHSASQLDDRSGFLWIQDDEVPMVHLRNGLKKALRRGLRIAIFNSCDGLGLARELADLQIPQVVVMREPIPDIAAHEFLKYFFKAFSQGQSLYLSVREAREKLQGIEDQFPCASWLPVICQNPAGLTLRLPDKRGKEKKAWWPLLRAMLPIAVTVAACVIGIRQMGLLQFTEWQIFDRIQSLRPSEPPDSRLLVVALTESDIQQMQESTITDRTLSQVLSKLEQYQPQAIGLDIYRDFPVPKTDPVGHANLLPHLLSPRCGL
jgi:hypothetical protein